jgi:hypothetical protein
MEWKIYVQDRRLSTATAPTDANSSFESVDQNTPLSSCISWVCQEATANNSSFVRLVIYCHGYETWKPTAGALDENEDDRDVLSQGGSGLQLCQDDVNLTTLALWQPAKGLLDWIEIHGCGAAYITPGCEGGPGDGNLLCSRFAQITGASVQASTATQYVAGGGDIPWTGSVYTYGPSGAVTNVQTY